MHRLRPPWHRSLLLILALIGALALVAGVRSAPSTLPSTGNSNSTPVPTAVSTPATADVRGFPVYPGATFVNEHAAARCEGTPVSGFTICDATVYRWEIAADGLTVLRWYIGTNTQTRDGWTCVAGGGSYDSPRAFSGHLVCTKGTLQYAVYLYAQKTATLIDVAIPQPAGSAGTPSAAAGNAATGQGR